MIGLLLLAAAQVQTIRLPPSPQVLTVQTAPDLVVKEIRIQDDRTMHVLVANIGTGPVADYFPVRATVKVTGRSEDIQPGYSPPLAAGGEGWVVLKTDWSVRLTTASSATAGADQFPEPKPSGGGYRWWPNPMAGYDSAMRAAFPEMKEPCKQVAGCIAEINEGNNNYAVAGVPRGTPERLNAPELAPVTVPERG